MYHSHAFKGIVSLFLAKNRKILEFFLFAYTIHIHLEHSVGESESSEGAVTPAGGLAVRKLRVPKNSNQILF